MSIGGINEQKVYFNDIDGEENGGAFKSDSVLIKDMNQKKLEEGGHWYVGKFEFSPKGSIKLSKKRKIGKINELNFSYSVLMKTLD